MQKGNGLTPFPYSFPREIIPQAIILPAFPEGWE